MATVNDGIIAIYVPKRKEHVFVQIDEGEERQVIQGQGAGTGILERDVTFYRFKRLVDGAWLYDPKKYESVAAVLSSFNGEEWK